MPEEGFFNLPELADKDRPLNCVRMKTENQIDVELLSIQSKRPENCIEISKLWTYTPSFDMLNQERLLSAVNNCTTKINMWVLYMLVSLSNRNRSQVDQDHVSAYNKDYIT